MISIDEARLEALRLSAEYHTAQDRSIPRGTSGADPIIATAVDLVAWLRARPASIRVGNPTVSDGGNPAVSGPATRSGDDMAVTVKDSDFSVTYPAPEGLDSKGAEVQDTITITTDDTAGEILAQQPAAANGSTDFLIGTPGTVQITWSDGNISFADTVNVTPGDVASIVVGAPTVNATDPNAAPAAPSA